MSGLDTRAVSCPYCAELIEIVIDCSAAEQSYTEDCQVCCRPMFISASVGERGELYLSVESEDEWTSIF